MNLPNPMQRAEYLVYRNQYIRGILPPETEFSKNNPGKADSMPVLVTWGSGFTQSVGLAIWNSREFLEFPEQAVKVEGAIEQAEAEAFFVKTKNQIDAMNRTLRAAKRK